jgi:dTDP-L-rhamnose 4-epimerase
MARILITGGAGFIGTHCTQVALGSGHSVRLLDNLSPQIHGLEPAFSVPQGAEFQLGDINCRVDVERAIRDVDCVIHLAAETGTGQSMYEIDRYYRVNVQGTALLLDVLANRTHTVANFILASSRSVYGEGAYCCPVCKQDGGRCYPSGRTPQQLAEHDWNPKCSACGIEVQPTATRESDPTSPASIYAATKLAQEELVSIAATSKGLSHSILRFQNVYGEGQSLNNPYTGILSIFSTRIRLGLPISVFEDGNETRDFVHVEDVARAVLACVDQPCPSGRTLNIGSGKPTSVMELACTLSSMLGGKLTPQATGQYRIGDIRHNYADLAAARSAIKFQPAIGLDEGLSRFCAWVKTQPIPEDMLAKANAELEGHGLMGR